MKLLNYPSRMFYLPFLSILLITSSLSHAAHADSTWKKENEERGVQVFTRHVSGTNLVAFRGEGIIQVPIEKVVELLMHPEEGIRWIDDLAEVKLVDHPTPNSYILYQRFSPSRLVTDRDFVVWGAWQTSADHRQFQLKIKSVKHPNYPEPGKYVRGEVSQSLFTLESISPNETKVIVETECDPKGSLPSMIVNQIQKRWPVKTIRNLEKALSR